MDKKRAISAIIKAAKLYKDNLDNRKVIFLYGSSSEIKKSIQENAVLPLECYETAFLPGNFLHLTGVLANPVTTKSAIAFYDKCVNGRLSPDDFSIPAGGAVEQKLMVMETMMNIRKNAAMIGNFTDFGPNLYAKKAAGGVFGCIGFNKDSYTKLNVPVTLLKKDIRNAVEHPPKKIFVVLSKDFSDEKYACVDKTDKSIDLSLCGLPAEIERKIIRPTT